MVTHPVPLAEVDELTITNLIDNSIDILMAGGEAVKRPSLGAILGEGATRLVAEHGLSFLVTVRRGKDTESLLFDAGLSKEGLIHNMDVLEIRPTEFRAIVLSHGHADHVAGLLGMLRRFGIRRMPLLLHPDAFLNRKLVMPDGHELRLPPPSRRDIEHEGINLIEARDPSLVLGGLILITGQVNRTTDFETGFPIHFKETDGRWEADPWIHDDQAAIVNVKGKGLVVLTGCGHSGVINILRHAQEITNVSRIHAVIGGFHLTGRVFEALIPRTVQELRQVNPQVVVPAHCTGWKATHEIARALPDAFVPNSVGSKFIF